MQSVEMARPGPGTSRPVARWGEAARLAVAHSLVAWPPIVMAWVLVVGWRKDAVAFDFVHAYLPAARAVLAGLSPYPAATFDALAPKEAFVYPPLTAYLAVPFTLLPGTVVALVASALALGCILAALRVLGVRDWRCYSIVLLWVPTYSAVQTANVTAVIVLALALLWRYRERKAAGLIAGFLIALKLFLWPVLLWLVVTRRYRAAAAGLAASVLLIVGPWVGIRFAGMRDFPQLLDMLSRVQRLDGYTAAALLASATSWGSAHAIGIVVGVAVLAVALAVGRKDERRSYALVLWATLLLSPIVWMHYFVVLLVVIALFVRELDWLWALPLLLWLAPQVANGAAWQTGLALVVVGTTVAVAVRHDPELVRSQPGRLRRGEALA